MKKLLAAITFIALIVSTTGCVKKDDLKLHTVENISISLGSTTTIKAGLVMENSSRKKISVRDIAFDIKDISGNHIAEVSVNGSVIVPKKSISTINVPIRIRFTNPIIGLSIISNLKKNAPNIVVSGGAKIKAGLMKKNFRVENITLSEFLSIFGASLDDLDKLVR